MKSTISEPPASFEEALLRELWVVQADLKGASVSEVGVGISDVLRRRRHWGRVSLPGVGAAVAVLAIAAGGIAAAVVLTSPTPQQASSIYQHYYPDNGAGMVPGTRPALNSELVLCDYQGDPIAPVQLDQGVNGNGAKNFPEAFASSAPLTVPLTTQMLVNACAVANAGAGYTVSTSIPATLCATGNNATAAPSGWPLVIFGDRTCSSVGASLASNNLLTQVNQRRTIEATIRAVPEACPTAAQATDWVEQQSAALNLTMTIVPMGGTGGSCYLPYVEWQPRPGTSLPWVEISPSQYASTPGTVPPSSPAN
jgi:hypothetical protein